MATQKATAHTHFAVLNLVNITKHQYAPNHPTYRQNVLFAMAATLSVTKAVPYIKNYNNAAASHPPQDITTSIVNQHNSKTSKTPPVN